MAKKPPASARAPARDWHEESRRIFSAEGLSERFFEAHEKEIGEYLKTALKLPLPQNSELFPKKFEPGKAYGDAEWGNMRGIPPPDPSRIGGVRGYAAEACADGGRLLNEFPDETRFHGALHEVGHHLLRGDMAVYNRFLLEVRRKLEADPRARIAPHPQFGTPGNEAILKLGENIVPQTILQRSFFEAHLGERASDVFSAVFRLSQFGKEGPQAARLAEQAAIYSHYRAGLLGRDPQHYSHSSMQRVLELHRQGKIPAHMTLEEAKNMTRAILKQDMPAIAQEYLALQDIHARRPLADIDPSDRTRFETLKQLDQQRFQAADKTCAPITPPASAIAARGLYLKRAQNAEIIQDLQREGVLPKNYGALLIRVRPADDGKSYEIRGETVIEEPSKVAGGDPKYLVDKSITVRCDAGGCSGDEVDYSRNADKTPLPAEKARAIQRAVGRQAERDEALKGILQPRH